MSGPRHDASVLITGARAPVALHLARLFHGAGWRVILADTPAYPLSAASKACASYIRLPPPRFAFERYGDAVEALIARENPSLFLPTCEEVFYLAAVWKQRGLSARLFAPDISLLQDAHNKYDFIKLCRGFDLAAPETTLLTNRNDLLAVKAQARRLVFKPVWSRFANHVYIQPTPQQLENIAPTPQMPWIAQEFLPGEEISVYAVANGGKLVAHSLYRSLYRAGKGAGIYFEPIEDVRARDFVERFVARTNWTGQISFDLMRLPDGSVLPLECNPRATSGLHFFRDPLGFVAAITSGAREIERDVTCSQTVRLAMWVYGFPAALRMGAIRRFRQHLKAADELLDWPGDAAPKYAQWRALGEIAALAVRHRITLQQASTRDIEWDGPNQSSI
ncbi:MAG: ATP-grasp domain-containing protein [Alphaproteobacteria bacterium]